MTTSSSNFDSMSVSSMATDYASSSPTTDCSPGCRCESDDLSLILFTNASAPAPRPFYFVSTPWNIFHFQQISAALDEAGFTVLDEYDTTYGPVPSCNWKRLYTTYALGVRRGDLAISNWTAEMPDGPPGLVAEVDHVLQHTYPFVEITLVVTITVFFLSLIMACCCADLLASFADAARGRRKAKSDSERREKPAAEKIKALFSQRSKQDAASPEHERPSNESSKLLSLPRELQDQILSHCSYPDLVRLRKSCAYYNLIIDQPYLAPRQAAHVKELFTDLPAFDRLNNARSRHGGALPRPPAQREMGCSRCLERLPVGHFVTSEHSLQARTRRCINCRFRAGEYARGAQLSTASEKPYRHTDILSRVFCIACQRLRPHGGHSWRTTHAYNPWTKTYEMLIWCGPCRKVRKRAEERALASRFGGILLAIVIFGVSCSGSVPARRWSWAYVVAMAWLTIYYIIGAITYASRFQSNKISHEPMVFGFLIATGWLGVAVAMSCEMASRAPELLGAPYDNHGKALIALCYLEATLAFCSFWITIKWQRLWLRHRKAAELATKGPLV